MTPLKAARIKKQWTIPQAAKQLNINKGTYWHIENGARVSPDRANHIAAVFGNLVTRDQLLFPKEYELPDEELEAKAS